MKKRYFYIMVILLLFISCNRLTRGQGSYNQTGLIPELAPVDSIFQKQLERIIFKSACFEKYQYEKTGYITLWSKGLDEHKQGRSVIFLFGSKVFKDKNEFGISINTYCGMENDSILGGFYVNYNNKPYLFIVNKNIAALFDMYKDTGKTIDVAKYMGVIEESDANLYVRKMRDSISVIYTLCP